MAEAGEQGDLALRLLAKHGDAALSLTLRKGSLQTVARFGDNAATALMKHGSVGENLIEHFGKEGIEALARVTPQNGRRLAMLAGDGTLKPELTSVVSRFGDQACDFIWRNKAALTLGATLTAFVSSPEEFLNGTQKLAVVVTDSTIKPIVAIPGAVATEAAKRVNWNLIVILGAIPLAALCCGWSGLFPLVGSLFSRSRKQITGKESSS